MFGFDHASGRAYVALTYGIQIPMGVITYLIRRTKRSWRAPASDFKLP